MDAPTKNSRFFFVPGEKIKPVDFPVYFESMYFDKALPVFSDVQCHIKPPINSSYSDTENTGNDAGSIEETEQTESNTSSSSSSTMTKVDDDDSADRLGSNNSSESKTVNEDEDDDVDDDDDNDEDEDDGNTIANND